VAVCNGNFKIIFSPRWHLLTNVSGAGPYYAEKKRYATEALSDYGIAIMRFEAPIIFTNVERFKADVQKTADSITGCVFLSKRKSPAGNYPECQWRCQVRDLVA
jgi:hypothetical protein